MGATCYMNVILQSFVHNPLLRNFYLGDGHQASECEQKNCMSCAMDDMFQDFYSQEITTGYSASNILASFWLSKRKAYEELASNKEQDAHEFFQFLTEELHEINGGSRASDREDGSPNPKRSKRDQNCNCIVHQTFYGKLQSTITCQNCGDVNTSVESFLDLSLGLDVIQKKSKLKPSSGTISLERCLDEEYSRPERCEYTCHQCDTFEAKKQLSIKGLPNVLCIQLKVFFPTFERFAITWELTRHSALNKILGALHQKLIPKSPFHCNYRCYLTPVGPVVKTRRITLSWLDHVLMICKV